MVSDILALPAPDDKLLDFCVSEKSVCPYFIFQGPLEPTDKRFHWAYPFLDTHLEPWKKIVISVGLKGDSSVEFSTPPSAPDAPGYVAPAPGPTLPPAAPGASPEAPAEARPH